MCDNLRGFSFALYVRYVGASIQVRFPPVTRVPFGGRVVPLVRTFTVPSAATTTTTVTCDRDCSLIFARPAVVAIRRGVRVPDTARRRAPIIFSLETPAVRQTRFQTRRFRPRAVDGKLTKVTEAH